jgi:hypothetical protein
MLFAIALLATAADPSSTPEPSLYDCDNGWLCVDCSNIEVFSCRCADGYVKQPNKQTNERTNNQKNLLFSPSPALWLAIVSGTYRGSVNARRVMTCIMVRNASCNAQPAPMEACVTAG